MEIIMKFFEFACSGFWTFIGVFTLIYLFLYFIVNGFLKLFSRFFRVVLVSLRGWPPSHLDADGDLLSSKIINGAS